MKKVSFVGFLLILIIGCEKETDNLTNQYIAKIVNYDLNCSTCILFFPNDSSQIVNELGESENCFYQTVNLDKNDFKIGQLIKVKVRKAEDTELKACITLYPSYNYENIYVTDYEYYCDFNLNDTIDLGYGQCLNHYTNQTTICFDTVLTDSRCPENVICIWAGEAIVRFKININQNESFFLDLHTGTFDTVVNGFRLTFLDLLPYPNTEIERDLEDYKARIVIKDN